MLESADTMELKSGRKYQNILQDGTNEKLCKIIEWGTDNLDFEHYEDYLLQHLEYTSSIPDTAIDKFLWVHTLIKELTCIRSIRKNNVNLKRKLEIDPNEDRKWFEDKESHKYHKDEKVSWSKVIRRNHGDGSVFGIKIEGISEPGPLLNMREAELIQRWLEKTQVDQIISRVATKSIKEKYLKKIEGTEPEKIDLNGEYISPGGKTNATKANQEVANKALEIMHKRELLNTFDLEDELLKLSYDGDSQY